MTGDVIPELGSMRPGAAFPRCGSCEHPWHGLPCTELDYVKGGDSRPCGCLSSFHDLPPDDEGA